MNSISSYQQEVLIVTVHALQLQAGTGGIIYYPADASVTDLNPYHVCHNYCVSQIFANKYTLFLKLLL